MYPHDVAGGFVHQTYLGVDKHYYRPTNRGQEALMAAYMQSLAETGDGAGGGSDGPAGEVGQDDKRGTP